MAIVGLKLVKVALVDAVTQKLLKGEEGLSETGIMVIDESMLGTKTANITNIEGSITKIPGNNTVQDVSVGPGSPQIAFDFNNLPFEKKQLMLGFKSDKKGGFAKTGEKPHVAVLIESETLDRANSVYFGFGNGVMQEPSQNVATDTDTAETRQNDNMTYTALSTKAFNGEPIKKYFSGASNFEETNMLKEVFGGYTAAAGGVPGVGRD